MQTVFPARKINPSANKTFKYQHSIFGAMECLCKCVYVFEFVCVHEKL